MSGITWTSRTSASDNGWYSVTYGNELFVAVSFSGEGNRVMTSPDGITWTSRTSATNNDWFSLTYGNGLFVSVSVSGTGNRVMTSSDGITWFSQTSAADNDWRSVTYGDGLFVAVSSSGTGNRVMTSPDGITWTSRTSAADNFWRSVIYGNGLFVAVSSTGSGNRVMTSPDGITWSSQTSAADNSWGGVTYGNGLFVAVSYSGSGNRVMTSGELVCVLGSTKILMKNGITKEIKDIKVGDEILEDKKTNKTNIVSRNLNFKIAKNYVTKIPKDLMDNSEDLFISGCHPVWVNNDKNRILAEDIIGVEKYYIEEDILYTLQFDEEGTYYAFDIKIDSLSPYHQFYPLPKTLFINKDRYIEGIKILTEDDEIRNKPKMIK